MDNLKFLCFLQLKNLERKHQSMEEELKTTLFYTRTTLILTVILAFMMLLQLYFGSTACPTDHETFHDHATPAMTTPNVDVGDSFTNNEL